MPFQAFLLAGERHIVSRFDRRGGREALRRSICRAPRHPQTALDGYFKRQSQVSLSQRTALLGPGSVGDAVAVPRLCHNELTDGEGACWPSGAGARHATSRRVLLVRCGCPRACLRDARIARLQGGSSPALIRPLSGRRVADV
jgi:hypothetical protein